MLDDKVPEVREEAASALGYFKGPKEIARTEQPLIDALGDDEFEVQKAAAYSLGDIGSKEAIPFIVAFLQAENPALHSVAVHALGRYNDPDATAALIDALDDESRHVRLVIVHFLSETGDPQAVDPFISLLGDERHEIRQSAANGLGKLGDQKAVGPLLKAMETEKERDVRVAEIRALGELGGPEAVEGLRRISTDMEEYRNVRTAAEEALNNIEGGREENYSPTS